MSKVIIIGSGPAGISASLYTQRANIETTIIAKGFGALSKAEKIENYYGLNSVVSGDELHHIGIAQAKKLGVNFVEGEVVDLGFEDMLTLTLANGDVHKAEAVILATGVGRNKPNIKGLKDFDGKGISYCAVCDAFFHRGKDVAVLGNSEYALAEALHLKEVVNSVTILSNGLDLNFVLPKGIKHDNRKIQSFTGENVLKSVEFTDGEQINFSGVFIALGIAGSSELARKLGADIENNRIVIDDNAATTIPGLFAAGDCTGGMLQISKAVYEGAIAGTGVIKYLKSL